MVGESAGTELDVDVVLAVGNVEAIAVVCESEYWTGMMNKLLDAILLVCASWHNNLQVR